jgi:4-hydroxy-tetrahydrodipicolinate reductase
MAIIGVVHYGLGPMGRAVAALVAERPWLRSAAAVDVSEDLRGRPLAAVLGRGGAAPRITSALPAGLDAAIALHCTGSSLERVAPQLFELVDAGLHIVSTTEELSFPWVAHPKLARRIDAAARARGVTVLGTGINPGFAMDYLPITLSAVTQRVDRVAVHRVQDAATRRLPLQRKVGAGLDQVAFEAEVMGGRLGHVGLVESVHALGRAFGWKLTDVAQSIGPLVAERRVTLAAGTVEPGQVAGIHQHAEGRVGDQLRVALTLDMAVGVGPSRDHVRLFGVPDLELEVPSGLHGDTATAAIVVNAIPRVLAAAPGLRVMAELPPPTPAPPQPGPLDRPSS